jgi:signal transduction histidine kinase/CHASE2 domain-containing sensor protein
MKGRWRGLVPWQWLIAALVLSIGATLSIRQEILWDWDHIVYDYLVRRDAQPPPDDVVVVAIDETSLEALGRWPWSRRLHAQLVDRLASGGAALIVLDILFAEADRSDPGADLELARAIAEAGNVIMPIANVEQRVGGQLLELFPTPALAEAARGFGHADLPLDRDGIARTAYLRAGLGTPAWPSLALAALEVLDTQPLDHLPSRRRSESGDRTPFVWVRDHQVWIPFIGPPGTFRHVSFADVLSGRLPADAFRDKVVFVGATATGLGDVLPTPVSGASRPMPGVEIAVTLLEGLRTGRVITPLPLPWQISLTIALILIPFFLFPRLTPQNALLTALVFAAAAPSVTFGALYWLRLWSGPSTAVAGIVVGYIAWSGYRLMRTLHFLNQELNRLGDEPTLLTVQQAPPLETAMPYLRHTLPLDGAVLTDRAWHVLDQWGNAPPPLGNSPARSEWTTRGPALWITVGAMSAPLYLGIRWSGTDPPGQQDLRLLGSMASSYGTPHDRHSYGPVEYLQARIWEVQQASERLRNMRRFVSESVSQLASGILVVDNLGVVRLGNVHAATFLLGDAGATLTAQPVESLVARLHFSPPDAWENALDELYHSRQSQTLAATVVDGRELLLQIGPFADASDAHLNGIIIDIVDITSLKEAERRRREMLSFLSHDLRAPLASILGITQLSRLKPEVLDAASVDRIEQHARKTLELADNFLHLARSEQDEPALVAAVDLASAARGAVDQVRPQAERKNMRLTITVDDGNLRVTGNEGLLERVFLNLLTNAVNYTPEGGSIDVAVWHEGERVCGKVEDTGFGIEDEQLSRLFERYETFGRGGHKGGTGLGLAFVKRVVEQHQGTVSVRSRVNQGTVFELQFPALGAD